MNKQSNTKQIFSNEQINQFAGFAFTFKRIHERLIAEGYEIENGKITPPSNKIKSKMLK